MKKNKNFPAAKRGRKILLFLFSILLMAGFFGFGKHIYADYRILINAVQIDGASADDDFIELYNPTCEEINLSSYKLKKRTGSGSESAIGTLKNTIPAKSYYLWENINGNLSDNPDYSTKTYYLSANYSLALFDTNSSQVDSITWGVNPNPFPHTIFSILNPMPFWALKRHNDTLELVRNYSPKNSSPEFTEKDELAKCKPVVYSDKIRINELYPNPPGSSESSQEFVEFYNFDDDDIDLDGWILQNSNSEKVLSGIIIPTRNYKARYGLITLHNDGDTISLLNPRREPVFSVSYGSTADHEGNTYAFDNGDWKWTLSPTPGKENELKEKDEDENSYETISSDIIINEILPNPKGDEKINEYIELFNKGDSEIDISGWILKDKTSTKYVFPAETTIKPGKSLLIYRKDFKFALNNSGEEAVYLLNPEGKIASLVSYPKATKEDVSYNFDGKNWRWSKFLTPGKKNKFNELPEIKKKTDKRFYVNVYANFYAEGYDNDDDKLKFTWDFGDGHKSYKKETRHKYKKAGKYKVTLKVSDGSEDKLETFVIKVQKYPRRSVRIISVSPNPEGKDSENEFIVVKNKSTKKVNLKGWSIATGSKKLTNHPIKEDFVIKPGKTAIITRYDSKFTLHNKKSKVELRYPDGKVASKLKYDKKKESVTEDELYSKVSGKWKWEKPAAVPAAAKDAEIITADIPLVPEPPKEEEIILIPGKSFTGDPDFGKNILAGSLSQKGVVLGTSTFRTYPARPKKEKSYFETFFIRVNSEINSAINYFFNHIFNYLH